MPNTTITSALTELGLGENEAMLYEILIKYPDATIPLLTKQTKLSRTMLYYVLKRLTEFALITTGKKDNKTVYEAVSPDRLEEIVREQQKELDRQKSALGTIMSDLRSTYNLSHNKPGVRFFEGMEGLKEIYLDTLEQPSTIYAILSPHAAHPELRDWLNKYYVKKRLIKKIEAKVIASNSTETVNYHNLDKDALRETIIIPEKDYPVEIEINIYGTDKVAFISYSAKEMIGIILQSPLIHQTMKTFFKMSWNFSKSVTNSNLTSTNQPPSPM